MSLYKHSLACPGSFITQLTLQIAEDGTGFDRAPTTICGAKASSAPTENENVISLVFPHGLRGFETFRHLRTNNIIQIILYPNSGDEPVEISVAENLKLTTANRGSRVVRPIGHVAYAIAYRMENGRLKDFRLDFGRQKPSRSRELQVGVGLDTGYSPSFYIGASLSGLFLLMLLVFALSAPASRAPEYEYYRRRPSLNVGVNANIPL
jgi:hypothetical protein